MINTLLLLAQLAAFWLIVWLVVGSSCRQERLSLVLLQAVQKQTTKENENMATVKERLGALSADLDELEAEDKAAFERLEAKVQAGETLTPEEEAQFDDIEKRLVADALEAKGIAPDPSPTPVA